MPSRLTPENAQVGLDRSIEPGIQRFADQRMADGDLGKIRYRRNERSQVALVQVVPRIYAEPSRPSALGARDAGRQFTRKVTTRKRGRLGPGVYFDAIGAEFGGKSNLGHVHVHKQTHARTQLLELRDQRSQPRGFRTQVEAMVGGKLCVAIGHQCALRRSSFLHKRQKTWVGTARRSKTIALDVELDALCQLALERTHVVGTNVAQIRSRVHRDTRRTCVNAGLSGGKHVGFIVAA